MSAPAPGGMREDPRFPGALIHPIRGSVDDGRERRPRQPDLALLPHAVAGRRASGADCVLGQNVMVGPRVTGGATAARSRTTWPSTRASTLAEEVFCGPSCVFTNVPTPRAFVERKSEFRPTPVGRGASIGANATVVCGHALGAYSLVAAGAVVTRDVRDFALVAGVPARRIGWVSRAGERLGDDLVCPREGRRYRLAGADRLEEI